MRTQDDWLRSFPITSLAVQSTALAAPEPEGTMAKGWFRVKEDRDITLFCWRNELGKERSKVIGPASLYKGKDDKNKGAWLRVEE